MSAVASLQKQGFSVAVDGGRLVITPASKLKDEHRRMIRENKTAIMAELCNPQPTDERELRSLVRACGEPYGFTEPEYVEAIDRAMADVQAALICYRAMASMERVSVSDKERPKEYDNRVTCIRCAHLMAGWCGALDTRGMSDDAAKKLRGPARAEAPARRPVIDQPRRCDRFKSKTP